MTQIKADVETVTMELLFGITCAFDCSERLLLTFLVNLCVLGFIATRLILLERIVIVSLEFIVETDSQQFGIPLC